MAEYIIQLPKKIGEKEFEALVKRRHTPKHYTISELKQMIEDYKQKTKELKRVRS